MNTNDYNKKIEKLTLYLDESEELIIDLQNRYNIEKNKNENSSKIILEYLSRINVLTQTVDDNENNIYKKTLELIDLKKLMEELKTYNTTLQKKLKVDNEEIFNLKNVINLQNETNEELNKRVNNLLINMHNKEIEEVQLETIYIKDIREEEGVSLFDELEDVREVDENLRLRIDKLNKYIVRLNNFYEKYMWFHRGINIFCLFGIIYLTVELYITN